MHERRLYAHRGASAECPENTLPAFERALELGCDALELDVHLTRDSQLIVAHDDLATRTTGAALAWNALDLAAAQRLDAGWGFLAPDGTRPFAGRGIYAPSFAEVLKAYPDVHLNVDIKGGRAVEIMLALLREHGAEQRVTLASFQTKTLVEVRRQKFAGETGLAQGEVAALLALPSIVWRQLPWTGNAAQVPTHQGPLRFDRAPFIAKCHSLGLRVDYWVIDDASEAARLLELGADGIMTNDPAKIAALFH
ncbi:MAG TPA: glycerophosphodiester phosphodiesterase family protein [Kofleriaceae bacterium]